MSVNSKTVAGRRVLSFSTLDDVVSDAEKMVSSSDTRAIGNWPLSKLLTHLTFTIDSSIDGFPVKAPFIVRLMGPLIKKSVMKAPKMQPGIHLPKASLPVVFPDAVNPAEALNGLRKAVARTKNEQMTADHPAFGRMTHDEWKYVHLRHCELHLSYATSDVE
jgi:hypothetical protein